MSIDTIIEVKTHKIKEQTETVQTCIQIKHYKNTLNSMDRNGGYCFIPSK
jgi:hypothetical protein